ncbi:glycyl-radical enzyme activating protein [Deltaproteobacteria bacterium TL4]
MSEAINETQNATILEIQRMSTEDGPGIRTTVFFKGCSLKCTWCHNPESISPKPRVQWLSSRCIGCKLCVAICPQQGLSSVEEGILRNLERCDACGTCVEECPSTAMDMLGKPWPLEALVEEVLKDRAYFEKSGGGVTLSGGEPTMQVRFAKEFLKRLKAEHIHTALDTCGMCSEKALEQLLPHADMILYDLKEIDSEQHQKFTGVSNDKILSNLIFIANYIKRTQPLTQLWIRTPIIPKATATKKNIEGIGKFISANLRNTVNRWELCAFNNLCKDKYERLGHHWDFDGCSLLKEELMESLAQTARSSGVEARIVHWSGSTQIEDHNVKTINRAEHSMEVCHE